MHIWKLLLGCTSIVALPALGMTNYDDPRVIKGYVDPSLAGEADILKVTLEAKDSLLAKIYVREFSSDAMDVSYLLEFRQPLSVSQWLVSARKESFTVTPVAGTRVHPGVTLARLNSGVTVKAHLSRNILSLEIPLEAVDFSQPLNYEFYSIELANMDGNLKIERVLDGTVTGHVSESAVNPFSLFNKLCSGLN